MTAGIPPLFATTIVAVDESAVVTVMALLTVIVGVSAAVIAIYASSQSRLPICLLLATPIPALLVATKIELYYSVSLAVSVAIIMAGLSFSAKGKLSPAVSNGSTIIGGYALFQALVTAFDGNARTAVVLAFALVLVSYAKIIKSLPIFIAASALAGIGFLFAISQSIPLTTLFYGPIRTPSIGMLLGQALCAVILGVLAISIAWTARQFRVAPIEPIWISAGLITLYASAGFVVSLALLVSPTMTGFRFGHAALTVSWTIAVLILLIHGIGVRALRVAGLALVGATLAKLVFFDLAHLDGIPQVLAFMGAGLILLSAGAGYAKLVSARQNKAAP